MKRIEAGFARYRNPYSGATHEVSLRPEDTYCLVFWSRNYRPLLPHLDRLKALGHRTLFHFTITGMPRLLETHVPPAEHAVETLWRLAERVGPAKVIWRFDPLVLSSLTDADDHLRRFEKLASQLEGATFRCIVSFVHPYGKVRRNFAQLEQERAISFQDPDWASKADLARQMALIAEARGMKLLACCNDPVVGGPVGKARCIDAQLIAALYPDPSFRFKPGPTREECGCTASRDIGAYDSCPHGCVYCYANLDRATALAHFKAHQPAAESLRSP